MWLVGRESIFCEDLWGHKGAFPMCLCQPAMWRPGRFVGLGLCSQLDKAKRARTPRWFSSCLMQDRMDGYDLPFSLQPDKLRMQLLEEDLPCLGWGGCLWKTIPVWHSSGALLLKTCEVGKTRCQLRARVQMEAGREHGFYAFDREDKPLGKWNTGERGRLKPAELAVTKHLRGALGHPKEREEPEQRGEESRCPGLFLRCWHSRKQESLASRPRLPKLYFLYSRRWKSPVLH